MADWFRSHLTNGRQKVEIRSPSSTQNFFSDWGTLKHGVPHRSILGLVLFIIYINDLPFRINSLSEPIIFADDTNIIISNRNFEDFCTISNSVLSCMIDWFAANKLVLNLQKTNIMKFLTSNSPHCALTTGYKDKYIEETIHSTFLGLQLDNHLNWKYHIDQMIPKLSGVCSTVRSM
jgi:hypothetical protein